MDDQLRVLSWNVDEDGYEEKIHVPKRIRDTFPAGLGDSQAVQIESVNAGFTLLQRFKVTGTELYIPVTVQHLLKGAGEIRLKLI
jgi:hypothetical protein